MCLVLLCITQIPTRRNAHFSARRRKRLPLYYTHTQYVTCTYYYHLYTWFSRNQRPRPALIIRPSQSADCPGLVTECMHVVAACHAEAAQVRTASAHNTRGCHAPASAKCPCGPLVSPPRVRGCTEDTRRRHPRRGVRTHARAHAQWPWAKPSQAMCPNRVRCTH